jgi:hypothetical protein
MSKKLQLRGGTTTEHASFTGAEREVTVDTTKDTLVIHDGSTAGGFPLPRTDAEIRAAVEAATDSNVFTNADHTKLNAIEASADVTDTVNVVAALTAGSNITIAANGTIAGAAQYTHPTHAGDDAAIDTGALSGATVISDLDLNITTDTLGHVTDANATVATRNLTLANLGYTGETNATADQTITAGSGLSGGGTGNVTLSHSDTSSQGSVNNSGTTYIQDITLDTYGHITGINSAAVSVSPPTAVNAVGTYTVAMDTSQSTSVGTGYKQGRTTAGSNLQSQGISGGAYDTLAGIATSTSGTTELKGTQNSPYQSFTHFRDNQTFSGSWRLMSPSMAVSKQGSSNWGNNFPGLWVRYA